MTADLAAYLRARWDEREAKARAATPGPWVANEQDYGLATVYTADQKTGVAYDREEGGVSVEDAAHIAASDPAHVLADIEAKRALLEIAESIWNSDVDGVYGRGLEIMQEMARTYRNRLDFNPAWLEG